MKAERNEMAVASSELLEYVDELRETLAKIDGIAESALLNVGDAAEGLSQISQLAAGLRGRQPKRRFEEARYNLFEMMRCWEAWMDSVIVTAREMLEGDFINHLRERGVVGAHRWSVTLLKRRLDGLLDPVELPPSMGPYR
jgi:hypothetical protein